MKNSDNKSAKELVKVIKSKGLTDAQLASILEVSAKTIGNWENGTFEPRTGKLLKLKKVSEMSDPLSLIEEEEEYDLGEAVRKTEATVEVILSAVAEILARSTGQASMVVKEQLEDLVKRKLGSSGS